MADDLKIGVDYSEVNQATQAVDQLGQTAGRTARKTKRFAATGLQQVGYQVGDFAVQVQSGTNAMVALGQQGSQLLGILGPMGAVAGAALAIATAVVMAGNSTKELSFDFKKFTSDMKTAFAGAQPLFDAIGKALRWVGGQMVSVLNGALKGLAKWYTTLAHLPAIAKEVFGRFIIRVQMLPKQIELMSVRAQKSFNTLRMNVLALSREMGNNFRGTFRGVSDYITTIFSGLKDSIKDIFIGISISVVESVQSMIEGITSKIDVLIHGMNRIRSQFGLESIEKFGESDFGQGVIDDLRNSLTGTQMSQVAKDAAEAFRQAVYNASLNGPSPFENMLKFENLILGYEEAGISKVLGLMSAELGKPLESVQDLRAALEEIPDIDLASYFSFVAKQGDFALSKMQERALELAQALEKGFTDGFMSLVDGTKSAKDAFRDMAAYIIKELYRILVVQQIVGQFDINKKTGATTKSGILGAIFTGLGFEGGGYTGAGPRAGGLDGKGGFMAMLHPNETVVDHTKGQTGGVVVNQTFNFSANGDESVKRIIASEAPKIASMTQQKLMDSRRRGGSMKQVFS